MATINYDYCEDKVLYDSGNIENELLDIYKTGRQATLKDNPNFFYTITPIRENIINWYPFKENSSILEVGGGLGAITGSLCKVAKKVVSNEYSKRRAENIYYRHKNYDNLEVIVGNIEKIHFKEKFDYIVLIGVFEYAKRFFNSNNPFHYFLEKLKSLLKDDGVILIAIENRYGIKYFAGATEDHYPEKYLGLNGYEGKDIQTFGKQELINIIKDSGFNYYKFYYPYPDYKMPYLIHTDERLPKKTELKDLYLYNHGNQVYNFDYRNVLSGIINNNQYGFFANSFLLEISNKKDSIADINFVKTFLYRKDNCQINTIFSGNNNIYKVPKFESSKKHLDKMINTNKKLTECGVNVASINKQNGKYCIDYIDGKTLTELISELAINKEIEKIQKEIQEFYDILSKISRNGYIKNSVIDEEEVYFKNKKVKILKIGLYDLHMSNIMKSNNKYYIIDQEWVTDKDVPLNYMMYFSIRFLFEWIIGLDKILNEKDLYIKYNITEEEVLIYNKMCVELSRLANNVDYEYLKIINKENQFICIDDILKDSQLKINNCEIEKQQGIKENIELKNNLISKENIIKELSKEITEQNINFNNLNKEYMNLISSKSWKYTKIFRNMNLKNRSKNEKRSKKCKKR